MHAQTHQSNCGATKLEETGANGEFVTRTIRKVIDEETARLENGLTVLASVGSTAPFVGLFGTDRKSVVKGKSVSVRVDLGGRRIIKKKKKYNTNTYNI